MIIVLSTDFLSLCDRFTKIFIKLLTLIIICVNMLSSGLCRQDNVTHRELPDAESADLTTYRYRPPRCLTTLGVIFVANYCNK